MPIQRETLASYRIRFLREVRDANAQFFNNQGSATPYADIDAWLNEAIAWRDLWSGGSRAYRSGVSTTVNQDQYDLATLFPNDTVLDVVNLWLIYGNTRVRLDERPLGDVTRMYRP